MNDPGYAGLYFRFSKGSVSLRYRGCSGLDLRRDKSGLTLPFVPKATHLTPPAWSQRSADRNAIRRSVQWVYLAIYFLSCASAIRACWPASDTAFINASAILGVDTLPERMLRNFMFLP